MEVSYELHGDDLSVKAPIAPRGWAAGAPVAETNHLAREVKNTLQYFLRETTVFFIKDGQCAFS